jgi:hypothetical protein
MFTENQVRQFYVTNSNAVGPSGTAPTNASSAGAMKFVTHGDEAYFLYKGPSDDGLQRTDLIKKCNIIDVRCTAAADLMHIKKRVEVTLATLNGSASPIVGQDYVLNVNIHNYVAMDYNTTKIKFGVARAKNTTASDLYKQLGISLAKNFNREPIKLVKIMLKTASTPVEVKASDTMTSLTSTTATGIIIEEVEQPWRRGAAVQEFVDFEVVPSTVFVSALNDDLVWGTVTDVTASNTSNKIPNSKKTADMEWFFHKERGDIYGELCWPVNIDTTYQVDPDNAYGYSFVDIHFYFEGNSHNVGKSEKTLTIVCAGKASTPQEYLKTLIGSPATTGESATAATGLYAFLEGTGVTIQTSTNW